MSRVEYLHLLSEKTALERMLADTPEEDVIDRASLSARLTTVEGALAQAKPDEREPARVRLTFKGRPVIGSHGMFAAFGMQAVNGFAESVAAMAASLTAPLAASGPIPNREQHQLLITSTAVGSFGFELEEYRTGQLTLGDGSAVAQALERTQSLLRGTLGTDDELADSAAEADRRALDKVRAFLETLADNEAVCTVQVGESTVSFSDVGQVRTSIGRLGQDNLREESTELHGELQGVLPKARVFEFRLEGTEQVIRGKIGPGVADADALNHHIHQRLVIEVTVKRVGTGRPSYVLTKMPLPLTPP
jgi:hypothetical protein